MPDFSLKKHKIQLRLNRAPQTCTKLDMGKGKGNEKGGRGGGKGKREGKWRGQRINGKGRGELKMERERGKGLEKGGIYSMTLRGIIVAPPQGGRGNTHGRNMDRNFRRCGPTVMRLKTKTYCMPLLPLFRRTRNCLAFFLNCQKT